MEGVRGGVEKAFCVDKLQSVVQKSMLTGDQPKTVGIHRRHQHGQEMPPKNQFGLMVDVQLVRWRPRVGFPCC